MKGPLHKKADKIKIRQDNSFPLWEIRLSDFNWLKKTVIRLEKENEELKKENLKWK